MPVVVQCRVQFLIPLIMSGSPAEKAGLQTGDRVIRSACDVFWGLEKVING